MFSMFVGWPALLYARGVPESPLAGGPELLTDPFLQNPTSESVRVVWFTEFEGTDHKLYYGSDTFRGAMARTMRLSRVVDNTGENPEQREIWRHEATATGLEAGRRIPYYVASRRSDGRTARSSTYSLQPLPARGQSIRVLLTSDHQLMPNTHINLAMVERTVGRVDAVFLAGDLVNVPDNGEEWFERTDRGIGFFPALQGRAAAIDPTVEHHGGEIIQHAHLFPVIGNHEVMGRIDHDTGFAVFGADRPRWYAEATSNRPVDGSWNTVTYREIFSLPDDAPSGEDYYAVSYGDVHLTGLFVTRPWRAQKFKEKEPNDPETWEFGDFLYVPFDRGSHQYRWLQQVLSSEAARDARIRYVMTHQASRGFGDNAMPLLTQPRATFDTTDGNRTVLDYPLTAEQWEREVEPLLGSLQSVRYDYPRERDGWHLDVEPLLERAGVDIVHHGHSHLWYRSRLPGGAHIIETSNVGNSYGAYLSGYQERGRFSWPKNEPPAHYDMTNYAKTGDPYGLEATTPSEFSPMEHEGRALPTIDSNSLTVFTILESPSGWVTSYVYDIEHPDRGVRVFDRFNVLEGR
jgi:hypothetical protein